MRTKLLAFFVDPSETSFGFHRVNPSGIVKGIPPRLNKKSKTFNWAGGVNIPPSFTRERNLPNMSKSTFKFLICQEYAICDMRYAIWDGGYAIWDLGWGRGAKCRVQRAEGIAHGA